MEAGAEGGGGGEGAGTLEPMELFTELGLLVVESRMPERSSKGRTQGPHCPLTVGTLPTRHQCDPTQLVCLRYSELVRHMSLLWRNNVPMCLEVLLLPECPHGESRAASADVSLPAPPHALLLEQWVIQGIPRRAYENHGIPPSALFQAVKSFLYFSQLSAWYNLTHGDGPKNLVYRISPPGEFCTSQFSEPPQWHTFPVSSVPGKHASIKVTVGSLPRREQLIRIPCLEVHGKLLSPGSSQEERRDRNHQGGSHQGGSHQLSSYNFKDGIILPPQQQLQLQLQHSQQYTNMLHVSSAMGKPRMHHTRPVPPSDLCLSARVSPPPSRSPWEPSTPQGQLYDCRSRNISGGGARPKRGSYHYEPPTSGAGTEAYVGYSGYAGSPLSAKDPSWRAEHHSAPNFELMLPPPPPSQTTKQPEPWASKVLTTPGKWDKHAEPRASRVLTPGKCEKAQWLATTLMGGVGVAKDSTDSDNSSPEIDRFLHKTLGRQAQRLEPLSPQEMECYLASLCMPDARKKLYQQHSNSTSPAASPSPTLFKEASKIDETNPLKLLPQDLQYKLQKLQISSPSSLSPCSSLSPPALATTTTTTSLLLASRLSSSTTSSCLSQQQRQQQQQHQKQAPPIASSLSSSSSSSSQSPSLPVSSNSSPPHSLSSASSSLSSLSHCSSSSSSDGATNNSATNGATTTSLAHDPRSTARPDLDLDLGGGVDERVTFQLGENDDCDPVKNTSPQKTIPPKQTVQTMQQQQRTEAYTQSKLSKQSKSKSFHNGSLLLLDSNQPAMSASNGTPPPYRLVPPKQHTELITTPTKPPNAKIGGDVKSLLRNVMSKEMGAQKNVSKNMDIPSEGAKQKFQESFNNSAKMIFHSRTGLPLQSSPAPMKKKTLMNFGYDCSLTSARAIKNSISCVSLDEKRDDEKESDENSRSRFYSTSAPASTNSLLGNFEESMLNGRLEPSGVVDGFEAEIGASGSFCPKHVTLPVTAFFFSLSDDNAPSPYLGHINLDSVGKRGYHIPNKGTVQVTLFNPNKTVVKMFVVMYDVRGMPPQCQTFLRQRTLYMPVPGTPSDVPDAPVYLRYLIHLRFSSTKSGKIYLHTDLRLIFARDKVEYDSRVANYELRSFTEAPVNPTYSPKK